ncbi:hypothetical protein VTI74DRAFT_10072 [Chaetomium olivicolor]
MDASKSTFTISCHCGATRQLLTPRSNHDALSDASFCHCDTCRHLTGLLCTSYVPISSDPAPSLAGLERFSTSPSSTRYFCSTCGCHVFRARHSSPSSPAEDWEWEVATGVITGAPNSRLPKQWKHLHVDDTLDGGLSPWLPNNNNNGNSRSPPHTSPAATSSSNDTLHASCHCTSISLQITRPSPDPTLNPDSPYPDLLLPYHSTSSSAVSNPSHEKWYLCPSPPPPTSNTDNDNNTGPKQIPKYLSGTCACPSCRLTSGFEIQTWAFIPRQNIFISLSSPSYPSSSSPLSSSSSNSTVIINQRSEEQQQQQQYEPLDFSPLRRTTTTATTSPLKSYESSPGRIREFCARCGATVFWHDGFRPDLIDVSVGLLRAPEGARAEGWLEWWTGRVSFSEEAGKGRAGGAKSWGEGVVGELEGRFAGRAQEQAAAATVGRVRDWNGCKKI